MEFIALDNTLVTHAGKLIEDGGWGWAHADQRHVIAHDDMIVNSVCPSGALYPIEGRRFQKRDACGERECKDHTTLGMELSDDTIPRAIPGDFAFDSYVTSAKLLHHLQSTQRAYVGALKLHRKIMYAGREQTLQEVAPALPWEAKPVRMGSTR